MLDFEIYAPVNIPINWQSELITSNSQRFDLLKKHLSSISSINIQPQNWPMGFGSLEHDNLPVLYQPCAVIDIPSISKQEDMSHAKLYVYDNCLAVLSLRLTVNSNITNVDDLVISKRVEKVAAQYLSPIFESIYQLIPEKPLIKPDDYKFFNSDKNELTNGKPMWVARMLTQPENCASDHYDAWLKNVDAQTDFLKLSSGNSLLTDKRYFLDVHRVMVMSQFHCALMGRIEALQQESLIKFNGHYYKKNTLTSTNSSFIDQQYRNDHIEFINIQISAAASGIQGRRRELFHQFNDAWEFNEQRDRINQLTSLTQSRVDRLLQGKLRQQNRSIQTLLAFLGSLGLMSLVVDLISLEKDADHGETVGLLDIIQAASAEHLLGLTGIIVIFLTLYFYKNHE